jgi:hypothetical protein
MTGALRNMRTIAAISVLPIIFATAGESGAGNSRTAGGTGGQSTTVTCPRDQLMVGGGARMSDDTRINRITITCNQFDANGLWVEEKPRSGGGASAKKGWPAGRGGGSFSRNCYKRRAIDAFKGRTSQLLGVGATVISHLEFGCRKITPTGQPVGSRTYTGFSFGRNKGKTFSVRACPKGEMARGVRVWFGSHLDRLYLICAKPKLVAAAAGTASLSAPEILEPANEALVDVGTKFRWKAVAGARRYHLCFERIQNRAEDCRTLEGTVWSFSRRALGKHHNRSNARWFVVSCDVSGKRCGASDPASVRRRRVNVAGLPAPVWLRPKENSVLEIGDTLTWRPVADAKSYRVCLTFNRRNRPTEPRSCLDGYGRATGRIANSTSFRLDERHRTLSGMFLSVIVAPCGEDGRGCGGMSRRTFWMKPFGTPELVGPRHNAVAPPERVVLSWKLVEHASVHWVCVRREARPVVRPRKAARSGTCDAAIGLGSGQNTVKHSSQFDLKKLGEGQVVWRVRACNNATSNRDRVCGPWSLERALMLRKRGAGARRRKP